MTEAYSHSDEFDGDDDQFESVFDATVPSSRVPVTFHGLDFALTPENTKIRLFGEGLLQYNRAVVDVGDGEWVDAKLDGELLDFLSETGFPTVRPKHPETEDHVFLSEYIRVQTHDLDDLLQ